MQRSVVDAFFTERCDFWTNVSQNEINFVWKSITVENAAVLIVLMF